jgi:hypothetical protein
MHYGVKSKIKIKNNGGDSLSTVEMEKARQARNAYHREWRAKNKEKVKEINARYWANRAAKEADEDGKYHSES